MVSVAVTTPCMAIGVAILTSFLLTSLVSNSIEIHYTEAAAMGTDPLAKFCIFGVCAEVQMRVLREAFVGSGAKICDLRDFFENTRYCGITCKKIAYMVKYGHKFKGMQCPFFNASQCLQGLQAAEDVYVFLERKVRAE